MKLKLKQFIRWKLLRFLRFVIGPKLPLPQPPPEDDYDDAA